MAKSIFKISLIFFFAGCLSAACHTPAARQPGAAALAGPKETSVQVVKAPVDTLLCKQMLQRAHQLQLEDITKNAAVTELRVWCDSFPFLSGHVCLLKHALAWQVKETGYRCKPLKSSDDCILKTTGRTWMPSMNDTITHSLDTLLLMDLAALPDQRHIPGFTDASLDGVVYTIEISTKGQYNIVQYHNPAGHTDSIHQEVNKLISLVSRITRRTN